MALLQSAGFVLCLLKDSRVFSLCLLTRMGVDGAASSEEGRLCLDCSDGGGKCPPCTPLGGWVFGLNRREKEGRALLLSGLRCRLFFILIILAP